MRCWCSYKIRMPWHPKRASNILSQTYNATTGFICYVIQRKLYFLWIAVRLTHLTTSGCNILFYASREINHFSRSKRKTASQNLSGVACHLNNRFGQSHLSSMVHTLKSKLYPIKSKAIAEQHIYGRLYYISLKSENMP